MLEANLTPTKMPEHEVPVEFVSDYLDTGMRTFLKFLRERFNANPRDYKYLKHATMKILREQRNSQFQLC